MTNNKNNLLTSSEFTYLLLGYVIATGFLKLPNDLVKTAGQDAWISVIIALVYPLYIILISCYIINKHPKENLLLINKKYFGAFLGNILNFIFMLVFLIITLVSISDFTLLTRTYIVPFLSPLKVIILTSFVAAYAASKELKALAKISQLIFYIFLLVFLLSLTAIKYGDILNLQPILGGGLKNILKTSKATAYSYFGWEALLLYYPYVEDLKTIKKSLIKAFIICGLVYFWSVFITIFYLGIDVTAKSYWSFILVFESITLPVINNFRYIFMFAWFLLSVRLTANCYYAVVVNLNSLTNIKIKKLCFIIYPFIIYGALKLSDKIIRDKIVTLGTPALIIYTSVLITVIALLILLKNKKNSL